MPIIWYAGLYTLGAMIVARMIYIIVIQDLIENKGSKVRFERIMQEIELERTYLKKKTIKKRRFTRAALNKITIVSITQMAKRGF